VNLSMGSQDFKDVEIPVLWGTRAIVQDPKGRISVIDLAGDQARPEVLADDPAEDIKYAPRMAGFVIMSDDGEELYVYIKSEKQLTSISLNLPDLVVKSDVTRVGTNIFQGNSMSGFGVGIAVTPDGISKGAQLPPGLAKLEV